MAALAGEEGQDDESVTVDEHDMDVELVVYDDDDEDEVSWSCRTGAMAACTARRSVVLLLAELSAELSSLLLECGGVCLFVSAVRGVI